MKRKSLILVPFLVPLVGLDVALILTGKLTAAGLLPSLGAFAVVFFLFWYFILRGEPVEKDERTIKLARTAATYSWLFSIYVVVLLSGSDSLGLFQLSGSQYLYIVMMTMVLSNLVVHLVLRRRGDVE
jgi:hypothetical protein